MNIKPFIHHTLHTQSAWSHWQTKLKRIYLIPTLQHLDGAPADTIVLQKQNKIFFHHRSSETFSHPPWLDLNGICSISLSTANSPRTIAVREHEVSVLQSHAERRAKPQRAADLTNRSGAWRSSQRCCARRTDSKMHAESLCEESRDVLGGKYPQQESKACCVFQRSLTENHHL